MPLPGVVDEFGVPTVDPWDELGQLLAQPPETIAPPVAPEDLVPAQVTAQTPVDATPAPSFAPADLAAAFATDTATPVPPAPQADAVTGADQLPQLAPTSANPELPPEYRTPVEEGVALSKLSPEALGILDLQHQAGVRAAGDRVLAPARQSDQERFELNQRAYREANARTQQQYDKLEQERQQLEKAPVGWAAKSTGQKIAGFLTAIIGGLLQGKTGSARNSGLDMIDQTIEQDLAERKAKMAELAGRRAEVVAGFARNADQLRQEEALRQGAWDQVIKQAQAEQQNYDPRGKTSLEIGKFVLNAQQQKAAALEKWRQEQHKTALEDAKYSLDVEKAIADQRHQKAEEGIAYQNAGTARAQVAATREATAQARQDRLDEKQAVRDDKAETNRRELGLYGPPAIVIEGGKPKLDEAGKPVVDRAPALVQADGKTQFEARTKEEATRLTGVGHAASEITAVINEVLAIRDRSGGGTATFNSDDFQRLKVLEKRLTILAKQGTQGMSSDEDMKNLRGAVGADDLTSFRARAAGLEEARDRVEASYNSELTHNGYNGAPVKFATTSTGPTNTAADETFKGLTKKPAISQDEAEGQALHQIHKRYTDEEWRDPATARAVVKEAKAAAADYKDITPDQRAGIENLGVVARYGATPAARDAAAASLRRAATEADTGALRAAAAAALQSAQLSAASSSEATGDPSGRAVARDEVSSGPAPRGPASAAPPKKRTDSAGNPL